MSGKQAGAAKRGVAQQKRRDVTEQIWDEHFAEFDREEEAKRRRRAASRAKKPRPTRH